MMKKYLYAFGAIVCLDCFKNACDIKSLAFFRNDVVARLPIVAPVVVAKPGASALAARKVEAIQALKLHRRCSIDVQYRFTSLCNRLLCALLISVVIAISTLTALAEGLPYRVLDVDKVISQSLAYTEFKSRLDKANQKYQKEIEFYESQLVELDKKIKTAQVKKDELVKNKQTIVLYESKVQELMQKRKEINERASDKAFGIMRESIEKLVYEYAKKNNLSIIFSRMQVMYFSNTVDITDQIIEDLNKILLKIDVAI